MQDFCIKYKFSYFALYYIFYSAEYNNLIQYIQNQKIGKNVNELYQLLRLISSIAQNHHRDTNLFILIEQLIIRFQEDIKQAFSNLQLFNIF